MNLDSMLEKCRRDQWNVGDLDWSKLAGAARMLFAELAEDALAANGDGIGHRDG
jgi:hypothetical protein